MERYSLLAMRLNKLNKLTRFVFLEEFFAPARKIGIAGNKQEESRGQNFATIGILSMQLNGEDRDKCISNE